MYQGRNVLRSLTGGIVLIGLALAFLIGRGGFFLPIFFVFLAFSTLIGSISSGNPRGVYGGIQGFVWLLGLALMFIIGFWPWVLIVAGISAILGALAQPILAGLLGLGIFAATRNNQQHYQYPQYQQPQQPQQQPYQPYQQGYQPEQSTPGMYREGDQQFPYPQEGQPKQEYDRTQTQYPQQMPPQQQ